MRKFVILESAISLLIVFVAVWAVIKAQYLLVYLGAVLIIGVAVFVSIYLHRWWNHYELIPGSHHGGYIQHHGHLIRLEPMIQRSPDDGDGVSRIPVLQSPRTRYIQNQPEQDDEAIKLAPVGDSAVVTGSLVGLEESRQIPDEMERALLLYNSGANSRMKLARAMGVTTHKSASLITRLKERGKIQ